MGWAQGVKLCILPVSQKHTHVDTKELDLGTSRLSSKCFDKRSNDLSGNNNPIGG